MLCLNGQTSSSLTGRTSGLPKIELVDDALLQERLFAKLSGFLA